MTGTTTLSIWRWEQRPSSGKATASGSLTVHFPALAPGTPNRVRRQTLGLPEDPEDEQ
jgi:hypothetical protein